MTRLKLRRCVQTGWSEMGAGVVNLKIDGAIARVSFSNPDRLNAFSLSMWQRLGEIIYEVDQHTEVRVVVLRGEGSKAFASGADLSEFGSERNTPENVAAHERMVASAQQAVIDCSKPVVACIQGICMGGGMGLALACDLRYAARDARFCMPATRVGIGYALDMMHHFVGTLGASRAAELFYTARTFDGVEAERIGLVHSVYDTFALAGVVERLLAMIAENAPLSVRAAKLSIRYCQDDPDQSNLVQVAQALRICAESHDYAEGYRAFMEKRRPRFEGR